MSAWTLRLLGGFALTDGSDAAEVPRQGQRVLALLALQGRCLPRSVVAGRLWPESGESRAHGSLRSTLWRLRRIDRSLVAGDGTTLSLASCIATDIERLTQLADRARREDRAVSGSDVDLAASTDELLPGWYEDWVTVERERVRQRGLHTLEVLARRFAGAREYARAIDTALVAIAMDPLRETAHHALIEIHLAEGNRSEAIRHYDAYHTLLREHLGIEPTIELTSLVRHDPSAPTGHRDILRSMA